MRFLDYFDNFLKSKRLYKENQAFWRLAVALWCEDAHEEIVSGLDGNPMLHIVFPGLGKSLRIVQQRKNSEPIKMSAWIQDADFDTMETCELVIVLQLTTQTYRDTEQLFKAFLENDFDLNEVIETVNGKYEIVW
jgi:hypothetical protein